MIKRETGNLKIFNTKWSLILYDAIIFIIADFLFLFVYVGFDVLDVKDVCLQSLIYFTTITLCRFFGKIYNQIWRYGGVQTYIRLIAIDAVSALIYITLSSIIPISHISFSRMIGLGCLNLLGALTIRMLYRYTFKCGKNGGKSGRFFNWLLKIFAGYEVEANDENKKIKIAIIGAGRIGVSLAEELLNNSQSSYVPRCFVDVNKAKIGREIHGIPVFSENEATFDIIEKFGIQEIVFAIHSMDTAKKKDLYEHYKKTGCKLKVYDYPIMQSAGKRHLREFDIEELLFRKPLDVADEKTRAYYNDKTVLITGGGGSIGSELCRQLAKMNPKQIILVDIYENGVYDVQQELRINYNNKIKLNVEIASITNKKAMERVFKEYPIDIVINAAAHKHVPLMETNCIEAVENNVFGTKNIIELCEKYEVERFMMVSTDKAVNPTNVMGATKRMCEMLAQGASTFGKVKYSATRFGNVLGSAGSVIPLFKKQIANGGPITLTDRRIIRYFMTIPEASQLVLQSGAMAKNGELFVLDMGQPVKILDLAEEMIRLSGANGIEIVETGLRPGEKLYEELLVKTEELDKTENSLIYIEKDVPPTWMEIEEKLEILKEACATDDDNAVREALRKAVPTFKRPEDVNCEVKKEVKMDEKFVYINN